MSYDQGYRQPPQRQYQDEYYERGAHMKHGSGGGGGRGQLNRFASQGGTLNANYRNDGMGVGGGGYGGEHQAQRRPPPPSPNPTANSDSAFPSFLTSSKARSIPVPPGSLPIDDSMLNMNLVDDRSAPRQHHGGPPPPGAQLPRSQTMQPERMRGRPPPNFARGGGRGWGGGMGMDPRYAPEGVGMRGPPPGGMGGPPPHQRLPPPRRQQMGNGYGGEYQGQWDERRAASGPPNQGYVQDQVFASPQRSMTMPSGAQYQGPVQGQGRGHPHPHPQQQHHQHHQQFEQERELQYQQQQQRERELGEQQYQPQKPQYTAYNPGQHGAVVGPAPVNFSAPRTAYARSPPPALDQAYNRESVGAILDDYYNEPEYNDGYGYQEPGAMDYYGQVDQSGHPVDSYRNSGQSGYTADQGFSHQAHRARSQPDLRGSNRGGGRGGGPVPPVPVNGYSDPHYQGRHYDGAHEMPAEMPGDLPPEEPIVMTANGFPPPPPIQDMPMVLRVGSPAPAQQTRRSPQPQQPPQQPQQPPPPQQQQQQQQMGYPPRGVPAPINPAVSSDSLPVHPSPTSARFSSDSSRFSHSDVLPAHPPPIRPGLLQQEPNALPNHPPPRRQYSPDRNSIVSRRASIQAAPITQFEFNQIQQTARASPGDQKLQLLLAKKMVEAASALADEGGRADAKTTRKNRENWIFDAHKIVKKLANSSHPYPDAMFYLAECYWEGLLGLQADHERAFNLYQSAAKLNHAPSAYRTAVCCELGAGTRKDPLKAMTWYKKASSLGDTAAMYKLGMILLKGLLGQPRNVREAINWLKRAADVADENNPHALHQLGLIYEAASHTDFVIPDVNYARELFRKAAELGYPPSQFRMGCSFEYGTMGFPIDPMRSITWYSRAAMQGEEESALALSGWYLTGAEGVIKQSDTEAYLWARKAAEKGLANAEYALGYFTEVGIGVSANLDEAKRWYFKAASQQHEKAKLRLQELKKGGAAVQKSRERLSRSNVKNKDDGECIIM